MYAFGARVNLTRSVIEQELTFTTNVIQNAELFATQRSEDGFLAPLCRVDREGRLLLQTAANRYGQAQLSLVLYGA